MSDSGLLRKDQLELSLHNEKKLIEDGVLKEDNPLDVSARFLDLCDACRRGDLKVCQEMITKGVNINARDLFDYTPLILVGFTRDFVFWSSFPIFGVPSCILDMRVTECIRPVSVDIMKSFSCSLKLVRCASEIPFKARGVPLRLVDLLCRC